MQLKKLAGGQGYWYLASPYSKYPGGIEIAFMDICLLAGTLIHEGLFVYSPICHTHPIALHAALDPFAHELWLPPDKQMAAGARGMIIAGFKGWRESFGISEEIKWFRAANKLIVLLDPAKLSLRVLHSPVESWPST
jgi:Domain of unknown function (DUF1937)